ncbi:hypothetical protein KSP40_PGU021367 [Platanthera guangdongensis]|uniref:Uncharacterized protein n=1 Tax=Platanthera guangdongensis TaxID=2320717 RepID=A0ABR2MLQ9_9ASPA
MNLVPYKHKICRQGSPTLGNSPEDEHGCGFRVRWVLAVAERRNQMLTGDRVRLTGYPRKVRLRDLISSVDAASSAIIIVFQLPSSFVTTFRRFSCSFDGLLASKGSLCALVEVFSCDIEVTSSSSGSNLFQKFRLLQAAPSTSKTPPAAMTPLSEEQFLKNGFENLGWNLEKLARDTGVLGIEIAVSWRFGARSRPRSSLIDVAAQRFREKGSTFGRKSNINKLRLVRER